MKDKISIGIMIYLLVWAIVMLVFWWKLIPALALLLSIPAIGGAIFAFYLKIWGGKHGG